MLNSFCMIELLGRIYVLIKLLTKIILHCMKQILTWETFEAFNHSSIFDKAVFCLDEKQGMLINDECSSWYNRVRYF